MIIQEKVLVEELERLNHENKILTESLNHMCNNYVVLQKHLSRFNQPSDTNFENEIVTQSRKRKAGSIENCVNQFGTNSIVECSTTTTEETFKRTTHNSSPKISKVLVWTDASNTGLVSSTISYTDIN